VGSDPTASVEILRGGGYERMTDDEFALDLSRRKALSALGTIGAASAGAGLGTSAFFSDAETVSNNSLVAGELDVKAAYSAHYSDWSPDESAEVDVRMWDGPASTTGGRGDLRDDETGLPTNDAWLIAVDDPDQFLDNTQYTSAGDASCPDGTDANDVEPPVIELDDVKPGDFGEVTFDFALCDNPGFVWLAGALRSAAENGVTEPEGDDPDEDGDADSTDPTDVELLDAVRVAVWVDDGDNYQDDEVIALSGSLRTVLDELQTGSGLSLGGNVDSRDGLGRNCFSHDRDGTGTADVHSVSFAWWLPADHANEIQSDSVTFDLGLYTEQCRHNRTAVDLEAVVASPEMQRLLTDLGHPSPADTSAEDFGSLGPVTLHFDQARTREIELDDPLERSGETLSTVVPSPLGRLEIISSGEDVITAPRFRFDRDIPDPIRAELALGGDVGWPQSTRAILAATESERVFLRTASTDERSEIRTATGAGADFAIAFRLLGAEGYVAPPTVDGTEASPLVPDGGTRTCGPVPADLCDSVISGDTFVLDPGFGVVTSFASDELFTGGESVLDVIENNRVVTCLEERISCGLRGLAQGIQATILIAALWVATLAGLVVGVFELNPRMVAENILSLMAGAAWSLVFGATITLTLLVYQAQCEVEFYGCLLAGRASPGPIERKLDPKGTFLRADSSPPPPAIIDLDAAGLSPGDEITIEQSGDTTSTPFGPERRHSTIAVFSGSAELLGPSNRERVPDAIDAGGDADTPRTFFGNRPTDIPEDFRVTNFDGSRSEVTVTIPPGATHLFIGAEDSDPTDNRDPDGDYRVTITRE
jgi:predicted ribosomally synthesized peptide with SipW-like signal peptide